MEHITARGTVFGGCSDLTTRTLPVTKPRRRPYKVLESSWFTPHSAAGGTGEDALDNITLAVR